VPALAEAEGSPVPKNSRPSVAAVVLAAGQGKRLKSKLPKVLHPMCGRPVLWHVLTAVAGVKPDRIVVVVHEHADQVREAVRSWGITPEPVFVDQGEPLGTGHAVLAAEKAVRSAAAVLVSNGDEPLQTAKQLRDLLRIFRRRDVAAVIQTTIPDDPRAFARVVRDRRGDFVKLAEGSDATKEELAIREVATGIYVFRPEPLYQALPLVGTENRQREYYLPDVLGILHDKGERIAVQLVDNGGSVGVNSRAELAKAAEVMRGRINARHMDAGVTLVAPDQTFVDVGVQIGRDTTIQPQTFLEGATRVGPDCVIGPATRIVDSRVGDGSTVQFSVVRESRIGPGVSVGPFASLRPGTILEEGSKAGTFVEIKASRVGKRSKVPHLSYVGDAEVGADVNIGAGSVTVNYDGWDKHRTVIGDEAKVGSDTMLVAPVKVGKRAMTGAGSVITKDVPAGALGVERSEQRNVKGYRDRKEREKREGTRGRG
jgi:bifunctional UDP-N-acetylglucosamine pyrophosphorylase/glucosamine-1-phosphate N-acetyltransferase